MLRAPDYGPFVRAWRERFRREEEETERARAAARQSVLRAVAAVVERFAPSRVWLVGSLPRGVWEPGSDIDLVVEGLAPAAALAAEREAAEAAGLQVDLMRLEDLSAEWRDHHLRWGERVHG